MSFSSNRPGQLVREIWSPQWLQRQASPLRIAIRSAAIAVLLLVLIWLLLFVSKGRFLKQPFESYASSYTGREVTVGGDFNLYFQPFAIRFRAENLRISNPEWARADNLLTARLLDARIDTFPLLMGTRRLHWLTLDGGQLALEYDSKGKRSTWTFDDKADPAPLRLPAMRHATITNTHVAYVDPRLALNTQITVDTLRAPNNPFARDIQFAGTGSMYGRPFHLAGSMLDPDERVLGSRNALILHGESADAQIDLKGTVPGPTEFAGADLHIVAQGFDLANLFEHLGITAPSTRAYRIESNLTFDGEAWQFRRLQGHFGNSDIAGALQIKPVDDRVKLIADLSSDSLDSIDAAPLIGYSPTRLERLGTEGAIETTDGTARVLPGGTLRIDSISRFDADLRYRVRTLRTESFPISDIDLRLKLDRSLIELKPFKAKIAGGTLLASVVIDARNANVRTIYDIRLSPTPMGPLLAHFGADAARTTGTLAARISLNGVGDSLRQSLASATGRAAIVMPTGAFAVDDSDAQQRLISSYISKIVGKPLREPVQINCGLIAFTIRNGVAVADPILIDTSNSVVLGSGGFTFRDESLALATRADSKTFSLFSGQSPVAVDGTFASPQLTRISHAALAKRGATANLGIVASPIAGLLDFVDPGDAKATQCGPVLSGARASAQRTREGAVRDDVGDGGNTRRSR